MLQVKIINPNIKPSDLNTAYEGDAGLDLYASIDLPITILANKLWKVPLGVSVAIPEGWVGLLLPRSSTGCKGLRLANTAGVIDSSYRGELLAAIYPDKDILIEPLDKICQLVLVPHWPMTHTKIVTELPESARGDKGFGSSGTK